MKNKILSLCAAMIAGGMLCACSDSNGDNNGRPEAGSTVNFALGSMPNRTVFDQNNKYQINWLEDGDKVRIYCNEAEDVKQADYNVVKIDATSKNKAKLEYNENGLAWGSDDEIHNFYAVYPADDNKVSVSSDGIATFKLNYNQTCTVQGSADANGHYTTAPDMTNAYMVANLSTQPVDEVTLPFRPIMTTLEITVKGKEGSNSSAVRITGVSVTNKSVQYNDENGYFRYNIASGTIVGLGETTSTRSSSIFVGVNNGDNNYIDLSGEQSITFTVFLPPVPINGDNKIDIHVHATAETSATYTVTVGGNTDANGNAVEFLAGSKGSIDLGYIPTSTQTGTNWITPLDGNIYVSQMSIPGSHDAATGEEMATFVGDWFGATQEKTLDKQWEMGARAFDLRPAIATSSDELWLYHGSTKVSISWATAMNTIKAKLTDNPGEFAIVLFRHEDESASGKNTNTDDFNTYMTDYVNKNKDWIVDWKPDLTIDEARGKLILISRFSGSWEYGCFTGWGHGQEGVTTTLKNATGTKSATMYVQDYFSTSSHDAKWSSIESYLNISRTFHTDPTKVNAWMINHCSGYVPGFLGASTSSRYRSNAAYQNPKLISYLQSETWEGSTGIILFDYVASGTSGNTSVYGDVAVQTVIDNNYKYRMKRKGE